MVRAEIGEALNAAACRTQWEGGVEDQEALDAAVKAFVDAYSEVWTD